MVTANPAGGLTVNVVGPDNAPFMRVDINYTGAVLSFPPTDIVNNFTLPNPINATYELSPWGAIRLARFIMLRIASSADTLRLQATRKEHDNSLQTGPPRGMLLGPQREKRVGSNTDVPHVMDNPGCDKFVDTACTIGCCAVHDQCYSAQDPVCTAASWIENGLYQVVLPSFGPFGRIVGAVLANYRSCVGCNTAVVGCILRACVARDDPTAGQDRCYDARCNLPFSCEGDCTPSPSSNQFCCECAPNLCDSPPECGNGSCEPGETTGNCWADCGEGNADNTCCATNEGCPSETEYTCPGSCCCCGVGLSCNLDYVCDAGDWFP